MKINPISFFLLIIGANVALSTAAKPKTGSSIKWVDAPWDIRYFIFINSEKNMKIDIDVSKKFNAQDGKKGKNYIYLDAPELLSSINKNIPTKTTSIASASILFDDKGKVRNEEYSLRKYTGKLSNFGDFVLAEQSSKKKPYWFASWGPSLPGDIQLSPALCSTTDSHRYSNDWDKSGASGNVGCREWAAQLYAKKPYINVTNYSKKGNFIGQLVGWARFEDRPTPVIGMQGNQWLCLYECPAGEQPGVIPDIQKWTRKYGFPMPVQPVKQPLYPDKDYDDINELWIR